MLAKSGPKLLDFGLAKTFSMASASGEASATVAATQEGMIAGTLQYMAPEQLESEAIDARTDIFAFGCVLYEMVAGQAGVFGRQRGQPDRRDHDRRAGGARVDLRRPRLPRSTASYAAAWPRTRTPAGSAPAISRRSSSPSPPRRLDKPAESTAQKRMHTVARRGGRPAVVALAFFAGSVVAAAGRLSPRWSGVMLGGPSMAIGAAASRRTGGWWLSPRWSTASPRSPS